jgi:hypothetical protein
MPVACCATLAAGDGLVLDHPVVAESHHAGGLQRHADGLGGMVAGVSA